MKIKILNSLNYGVIGGPFVGSSYTINENVDLKEEEPIDIINKINEMENYQNSSFNYLVATEEAIYFYNNESQQQEVEVKIISSQDTIDYLNSNTVIGVGLDGSQIEKESSIVTKFGSDFGFGFNISSASIGVSEIGNSTSGEERYKINFVLSQTEEIAKEQQTIMSRRLGEGYPPAKGLEIPQRPNSIPILRRVDFSIKNKALDELSTTDLFGKESEEVAFQSKIINKEASTYPLLTEMPRIIDNA